MINNITKLKAIIKNPNITSAHQPIVINPSHSYYKKKPIELSQNEIADMLFHKIDIDKLIEYSLNNPIHEDRIIDKDEVVKMPFISDKFKHQKDFLFSDLASKNRLILSSGVGTGKTLMSLYWFITKRKPTDKLIVFTKKNILPSWKNEWIKIFNIKNPEAIKLLQIVTGSSVEKLDALHTEKKVIYITNYESLLNEEIVEAIKQKKFSFCFFDESHNLKNIKSSITNSALYDISQNIPFVILLSGTVFAQRESDIFSQISIVDRGESFGGSFESFKAHYLAYHDIRIRERVIRQYGSLKDSMREEFSNLISKYMYVVPEIIFSNKVYKNFYVELSNKELFAYKQMYDDNVVKIEEMQRDNYIIAEIALVKMLKLRQITSGFINRIDDESGEVVTENIGTSKLDAITTLVTEILNGEIESTLDYTNDNGELDKENPSVCIVCQFKQEIILLEKNFNAKKIPYLTIKGGTKADYLQSSLTDFKNRKIKVAILQARAAGEGINGLQHTSNHMIFFSNSHSRKDREQVEGRINRGGQPQKKCYYYDVIASIKDGLNIDMNIINYLQDINSRIEDIMGDILKNFNVKVDIEKLEESIDDE